MEIIALTNLLTPCLSFLLKLEESKTESATDRLDKSAWQKAQSVWIELSPNVEAKASAKEAAIDVANKPEDEDAQAAFRNQLKKLLANDQALANRLANILQADLEPDSSAASASEVKTILVLAANPKGTSPLRLGEEVREIQDGLDRSRRRDRFRIEQRWAVRPKDIQRALLDCCPQIVHFSGMALAWRHLAVSQTLLAASLLSHRKRGLLLNTLGRKGCCLRI